MTNNEIIYSEAIAAGIYTQEQADAILATGAMLPIHTFQEWKKRGYSVKKGEHAAICCQLWKFTNKPTKAAQAAAEAAGKEADADPHYYLAKAFLFTAAQVQPIKASSDDDSGEELPF